MIPDGVVFHLPFISSISVASDVQQGAQSPPTHRPRLVYASKCILMSIVVIS